MCKNISGLTEADGLYYSIEFLISIIRCFGETSIEWKTQNIDIVFNIFNFGMSVLMNTNTKLEETQGACLKLAAECVKVGDFHDAELKTLKVVTNLF